MNINLGSKELSKDFKLKFMKLLTIFELKMLMT